MMWVKLLAVSLCCALAVKAQSDANQEWDLCKAPERWAAFVGGDQWCSTYTGCVAPNVADTALATSCRTRLVANWYGSGLNNFRGVVHQLLAANPQAPLDQQLEWAKNLWNVVSATNNAFHSSNQLLTLESARQNHLTAIDTIAVTNSEADVNAENQQLASAQANFNGAQQQVALNQQHLNNAQANLNSAQRAVDEANEKVRKAREDCLRRRRKRSWWTKIRDAATKPFRQAICRTIDVFTNDVNKAKNVRGDAENYRNQAAAALTASQQQLAAAQQQVQASQAALDQATQQLAQSRNTLTAAQNTLAITVQLSQSVKQVLEHVDRVVVGSGKMVELCKNLELLVVSLETVLVPMNHVANQLTAQSLPGVQLLTIPQYTPEQKAKVVADLQALAVSLAGH